MAASPPSSPASLDPPLAPAAPPAPSPDAGETDGSPASCRNCGSEAVQAYCPACGQRQRHERLTLRGLGRDLVARVFNLEDGLLLTLRRALADPGGLARAFVAGERRRYVNPLSFFLLAATLALFSLLWLEDTIQSGIVDLYRNMGFYENMEPKQYRVQQKLFGEDPLTGIASLATNLIVQAYTYLMLVQALVYAAFVRFFFGNRYLFAETVVLGLYGFGAAVCLSALLSAPVVWAFGYTGFMVMGFATSIGFILHATLGFYARSWKTAALALLSYVLTLVAYTLVSGLLGIGLAVWRVIQVADQL